MGLCTSSDSYLHLVGILVPPVWRQLYNETTLHAKLALSMSTLKALLSWFLLLCRCENMEKVVLEVSFFQLLNGSAPDQRRKISSNATRYFKSSSPYHRYHRISVRSQSSYFQVGVFFLLVKLRLFSNYIELIIQQ